MPLLREQLLKLLGNHIEQLLAPPPPLEEQRVTKVCQEAKQRTIDDTPIISIP